MRAEALAHLPIETPRLRLRRMEQRDLDDLARMLGDPEVMRHFPKPLSRQEAQGWIDRTQLRYQTHGTGLFVVERRSDGAFLGDTGLLVQEPDGVEELEVGYHFAREAWGQGHATEAARACVDLAFGPLGRKRVIAFVRPDNDRSRAVARRLGMSVEKQVQYHGLLHDMFVLDRAAELPPAGR